MWDRLVKGVQDLMLMSSEVKSLSINVANVARETRELDMRLMRVETILEMSGGPRARPRRLPPRS